MGAQDLLLDDVEGAEGIAAEVETHYRRDQDLKRYHALKWEESMRYIEGDHSSRGALSAVEVGGIPQPSHRTGHVPRPHTNYIYYVARLLMSQLISNLPKGTTRPKSNRDEDQVASRVANAVREVLWEETREDERYREAASWVVALGSCIKKDYLDYTEDARRGLMAPARPMETAEGVPLHEMDGSVMKEDPELPELVVNSAILSPFQFSFDPLASSFDDAEWLMETSVQRLSWIQQQFDPRDSNGKRLPGYTGKVDDVVEEQALSSTLLAWYRLKSTHRGSYGGPDTNIKDAAVVKEYYRRPSAEFPEGRCAVVANGITLYEGDSPYAPARMWHPYTFFSWFPYPGRVWPIGPVEQCVPVQRRINSIDTFWMLYRHTTLAPKWLMPKGSGIPRNQLTGRPGQVVEFNAGAGEPHMVAMPQIGSEIVMERDRAIQDLKEIAGISDPISGERAKGVPSYSAQAFLQENAQSAHGVTYAAWEKSIERSEAKRLRLVALAYDSDRPSFTEAVQAKLKNMASEVELKVFKGADLKDNVSVRVEPGSSIPKSRVLYKQQVMELLQTGILGPVFQDPSAKQQFFELFEIEGFAAVESEDVLKAEAENAMASQGEDISAMILQQDNHQLHIDLHGKRNKQIMRNTPDGKPTPEMNAIQAHIMKHQSALQEQMMQNPEAAAAAGAQGQMESGQMAMGPEGMMQPMGAAPSNGTPQPPQG